MSQSHTPSTRIVTRDGRRYHKVVCSCGHLITTTDSANTAEHMKTWHQNTPECPSCHHRNIHGVTGCTYAADPATDVQSRICLCIVGASL